MYLYDSSRHIVCLPYSLEGLHAMAEALGIKPCWFHRDHYDIPKKRFSRMELERCLHVSSRTIMGVIRGNPHVGFVHCLLPAGNAHYFPLIDKELARRKVGALVRELGTGGRIYKIAFQDAVEKFPRDKGLPYLPCDDQQGWPVYYMRDAASTEFGPPSSWVAIS
jgi:hypothetical protein